MFGQLAGLARNLGGGILDAAKGLGGAALGTLDMGKQAATDPLEFLKGQTNIDEFKAMMLPPDEYAEWLKQNSVKQNSDNRRKATSAVPIPQVPNIAVPNSPGGFMRDTPGYLNNAQMMIGAGPYG
jgi:hypothetical protein